MRNHSTIVRNALLAAAGLALLVLAARELKRTASDPSVTLNYFFNGDTLYPAALCADLADDPANLESWRFTGATDIYPDVLLYALAWKITGDVAPAMVLCSVALFVLLLVSAGLLIGALTESADRLAHWIALAGMGALFLALNAACGFDNYTLRCPLQLTCHGGSTICVISGLAIVVHLLFADSWRRGQWLLLALLFVQTALCMASDRLILIQLVTPCIATLVCGRLMLGNALPAWRLIWIGSTLAVSAALGQVLLRLLQQRWEDVMHPSQFTPGALWRGLNVAATGTAKHLARGDVPHSVAVVALTAALVFVGSVGWRRLTGRLDPKRVDPRLFLAGVFFVALTACSIGAATVSGMLTASVPLSAEYQWTIGTRYFLPVFLLPFFLASYIGTALLQRWLPGTPAWPTAVAALLAATGAILLANAQPRAGGQEVWRYYPSNVRELDEAAARAGARDGLADHHSARVFTLLSRRGLRVRAVMRSPDSPSGCAPYPKLGNMRWYAAGQFAPSFIVLYDDGMGVDLHRTPSRAEVVARFGEPAETATAGGLPVLIYPRNGSFSLIPEVDAGFIRESYSFRLHETIRFPAEALTSPIGKPKPSQPRRAVAGIDLPGVLTHGPLMAMRKRGVYRVRAIVSASGSISNGRLEVSLWDPGRDRRELCGVVELPVGIERDVSLLINVDDRLLGRLLDARVYFHGIGELELHAIEVARSP